MSEGTKISRTFGLAAGLLLCSGLMATSAMADILRYDFVGDVDHVGGRVTGPFNTSSPMSAQLTVDTTDRNSNPNYGSYKIQSFQVTIGEYTATFGEDSVGRVRIHNLPGGDSFVVRVKNLISDDSTAALLPRFFKLELRGADSLFSNDRLPGAESLPPNIGGFAGDTEWRLRFGRGGGDSRVVSGDVESLSAVPLPASVILFGVGIVALIGLGAGGLRNIRLPQA